MPRPSAAFSKLRPDYHCGDRALRVLGEHVKSSGWADDLRAALASDAPAHEVQLPGFNLFSVGARSPYEWCVPKPKDAEQVILVYEEYVDRELGKVHGPERVAKRLYGDYKVARAYFGPSFRAAECWYTPAAKILAAAQHFGVLVERNGSTLSTALLGYTLVVGPNGCHSNLHRSITATKVPAADSGSEELAVPLLRTKHRLANALLAVGADEAALWAANTAIRAEENGLVDTKDLFPPKRERHHARGIRRRQMDLVHAATLEATEIAQSHRRPIPALYEVLVPTVCTAQRFKTLFGHPWLHPNRKPRPNTRIHWVSRIEQLSKEANNNA